VRTSVDVHNYLVQREIPHEVFAARGRLRSAERIAAVLDLPANEVGRVVVFEGPSGGVAAVAPVSRHVDGRRLAKLLDEPDLTPAPLDRASELTGYLPESIPPAGLPGSIQVVVDPSLDREDVLYFPGGEARAVLKIRGKDLVRATRARVGTITRKTRLA
jgi:prolyl-tRNA editing enzyme YbaK/EbsC (Cys-tRNA(Pro) deacylase)